MERPSAPAETLMLARAGLILRLRQMGITDRQLLVAFEGVPHERFLPPQFTEHAYGEEALPIDCGQSTLPPHQIARLLALLDPAGAAKLLEVGTGTGYATALMSVLARRVYSVERFAMLARAAQKRWQALSCANVIGFHADGMSGLPAQAPFTRILLTGSVDIVPPELADQLAENGVLVGAVGPANVAQTLVRITRQANGFAETEHGLIRLLPLERGKSAAL